MTDSLRTCYRKECTEPAVWQPVLKLFASPELGKHPPAVAHMGLFLCDRHHVECGIDDLIDEAAFAQIADRFIKRGFAVPDRSRAVVEFVRVKPSVERVGPRDLVAHSFKQYLEAVGLADCPPAQRRELKRAFFAGAFTILTTCNHIGADYVPEQVGEEMLGNAIEECQAFKQAVLEGRE